MAAQAIETQYAGYRFRSRLEARWAIFFDALGVKWEYENEGYKLKSGSYLPDFWLPDLHLWVEIKGPNPTELEKSLLEELTHHHGDPGVIFSGLPSTENHGLAHAHDSSDSGGGCSNWLVNWAICTGCNQPQVTLGKDKEARVMLRFDWLGWEGDCSCPSSKWDLNHTRILAAINAAKQARFEHGERGLR